MPARNYFHAVFRQKTQMLRIAGKHDGFYNAFFIFEREIQMTGAVIIFKIGDFSRDEYLSQVWILLQKGAGISVQLRHAENHPV